MPRAKKTVTQEAVPEDTVATDTTTEDDGVYKVTSVPNLWFYEDEQYVYFMMDKTVEGTPSAKGYTQTKTKTGGPKWITDNILLSMTFGLRREKPAESMSNGSKAAK